MNTVSTRWLSVALGALLTSIALAGCSGPGCYDCGECGIVGGPATSDELSSYRPGVTADGLDAVEIQAWAEGTCAESDALWVVFDPAGVVIRRPDAGERLDTTGVTGSTFPDGRTLSADWTELRQELVLTLGTDTVTCVPGEGATVACTAM